MTKPLNQMSLKEMWDLGGVGLWAKEKLQVGFRGDFSFVTFFCVVTKKSKRYFCIQKV